MLDMNNVGRHNAVSIHLVVKAVERSHLRCSLSSSQVTLRVPSPGMDIWKENRQQFSSITQLFLNQSDF